MPLTIHQLYIRLADGLSVQEALHAAGVSLSRWTKMLQRGEAFVPAKLGVEFALELALDRHGDVAAIREALTSVVDMDGTVGENAERLARHPPPLLVVVRDGSSWITQTFAQRQIRKTMKQCGAQDARLLDTSRIALDFFTRLEEVVAHRDAPPTEGCQTPR